jgi:uncharacterized protein YbjT (DUF2867 family)
MTSPILVTGGTGTLGRLVVRRLREAGCDVRVLSRRGREAEDGVEFVTGDLATGDGIQPAVDGAGTIVHLAGGPKGDEDKARNLVRAASRAGAAHLVYISVVGAERIPIGSRVDRAMFGYFGSKLAAERLVADSGLPFTTLRATQFHDLILTVAQQMAKLPVILAPAGFRFQPVDADEVAARLVELALGTPAGLVPDMGGPRVYGATELLRGYLQADHRRRPIVPVWLPGKAARVFRAGANLAPEQAVGHRSWEEFLAERLGLKGDGLTGAVQTGNTVSQYDVGTGAAEVYGPSLRKESPPSHSPCLGMVWRCSAHRRGTEGKSVGRSNAYSPECVEGEFSEVRSRFR